MRANNPTVDKGSGVKAVPVAQHQQHSEASRPQPVESDHILSGNWIKPCKGLITRTKPNRQLWLRHRRRTRMERMSTMTRSPDTANREWREHGLTSRLMHDVGDRRLYKRSSHMHLLSPPLPPSTFFLSALSALPSIKSYCFCYVGRKYTIYSRQLSLFNLILQS